jgi:hypothetical protein
MRRWELVAGVGAGLLGALAGLAVLAFPVVRVVAEEPFYAAVELGPGIAQQAHAPAATMAASAVLVTLLAVLHVWRGWRAAVVLLAVAALVEVVVVARFVPSALVVQIPPIRLPDNSFIGPWAGNGTSLGGVFVPSAVAAVVAAATGLLGARPRRAQPRPAAAG